MRKGLVLGKFLPLHNGHLALIEFAAQRCDELIVWLCAADHEPISEEVRMMWLEKELRQYKNVKPLLYRYSETGSLSSSSEASWDISRAWAQVISKEIGSFDVLFTSEPYGNYLSELLGVDHILFDQLRKLVPVSGTEIRATPYRYWSFLPTSVKEFYFRSVCIVGTESTGKTELTKRLADHFNSDYVPEIGRDLVEDSTDFEFEILFEIADLHARSILEKKKKLNKILFIDTDINITRSYARFAFGQDLVVADWIEQANRADLYLYLDNDVPFIQDGTRMEKTSRDQLDLSHKVVFQKEEIDYCLIRGDWEERFQRALKEIYFIWK